MANEPTQPHPGQWLREKEAAAYLGMKLSTLRDRRKQNLIPFYRPRGGKLVFYRRSDLDAFMEEGLGRHKPCVGEFDRGGPTRRK